jgi:hypothetical protein
MQCLGENTAAKLICKGGKVSAEAENLVLQSYAETKFTGRALNENLSKY